MLAAPGYNGLICHGSGLFDGQELDVEDQGGVGRNDAAGAARSVTELGRNAQSALAPDPSSLRLLHPSL